MRPATRWPQPSAPIVGGNTIKIYSRADSLTAIHIAADSDDPLVRQLHFTGNDDGNTQFVIAGTAFDARPAGELRGDSTFTLEIILRRRRRRYPPCRRRPRSTSSFDRLTRQGWTMSRWWFSISSGGIDAAPVANGLAAGDVIVSESNGTFSIAANPATAIKSIRLLAPTDNPARAELGLGAVQDSGTIAPAVVNALNRPTSQRPGIFERRRRRLTCASRTRAAQSTCPYLVRPDGTNVGTDDLLADIQTAVATALTASGRPTTDVTVAIGAAGTLEFTGSATITSLHITATGGNPVQTQLGFDGDQRSDSGNLGLDDLRQDVQAAVDNALASTPGFRSGDVIVGIETTPTGGTIRFGEKSELGFGPVQEASGTAHVPAVIQGYAAIDTPRSGVLSAIASFDLQVTIGGVTKTVTVNVPVDSANVQTAD